MQPLLCKVWKVAASVFVGALITAGGSQARADGVDDAVQRLVLLDQQVHIMALEFNDTPPVNDLAERRLVDGQGMLGLGRRDQGMSFLLDVVARWPSTRAAQDARFLLGDTLFELQDYRLARRYYHEAVSSLTGRSREQRALGRLIEIALHTGDFEDTEQTLAMLARFPAASVEPAVLYVKAKLLYYREQLDEATRLFASITSAPRFGLRARYFLATILVKKGDFATASGAFDELTRAKLVGDDAREIQDRARLALARLEGARGRLERAVSWYETIGADSKVLPDALYELGWTRVRSKDFPKAYASFDRLLKLAPGSAQAPELKVLLGNLDLRLGEIPRAALVFEHARGEVEPGYQKLRAMIARSQTDPAYRDSLSQSSLGEIDLATFVPAETTAWVRADPEVNRLLTLASDVGGMEGSVADARDTVRRIETVVAATDPLVLFPDLATARRRSIETLAELVVARAPFARRVRDIERPHLGDADARWLDRTAAERVAIEQQLGARETHQDESSAAEDGNQAFLVAGRRPVAQAAPQREMNPVSELRAAVLQLGDSRGGTRFGIAEALRSQMPTAASGTRERALAERLQQLGTEEERLRQTAESHASASERGEIARDLEVLTRADAAVAQLLTLDARIDSEAAHRLALLQEQVVAEHREVSLVDRKVTKVLSEAQSLGGGLVRVMYTRVADRLYDLMVRADVGLIDVAWAWKDRSTGKLTAVLKQKNSEEDALRDELIRQEDALARRFDKESKWDHAMKLRP